MRRCEECVACESAVTVVNRAVRDGVGGVSLRAETIDRVLAVVAGQVITLTDVRAALDLRLQTTDDAADPVRAVLTKLIDRELMLAEVDRYAPPEPTAEAVDREVAARARAVRVAGGARCRAGAIGIDEKHLRETLRQDLRIRAYLDQRFTAGRRPPAGAHRRLAGRPAPARRDHRSLSVRAVTLGRSFYFPIAEKLHDLQQVEAGVAHHRRDRRSPAQVDDSPERAEQPGRDRRVDALQQVTGAERRRW